MPLFKVSVGSEVPVSAVVVSTAKTMPEAIAEVRLLQSRARVNWRRGSTAIGAIEAPYEIWAQSAPNGSFVVSLAAKIPISSIESLIADDAAEARQIIQDKQVNGLIEWTYRGVPVGDYRDPIPTFWVNQQPDQPTATSLIIPVLTVYPGQSLSFSSDITAEDTPVGSLEYRDLTTGTATPVIVSTAVEPDAVTKGLSHAQAVAVLPSGSYTIGAFYLGSDGYQASASSTLAVSVQKIATSVSLEPPNPPIYAGQTVSLSVIVQHANPSAPKPSGIVTLFDGTTVISSSPLNSLGLTNFNLGQLPPAAYSFTAQYEGDNIHDGSSSSAVGVTVTQVPTTTTLAVTGQEVIDANSDGTLQNNVPITVAVFSQSVRLTARVQSGVPNTVPTGTVTFKDGATPLGTVALTQAPGEIDSNGDGIIDPSTDTSYAFLDTTSLSVAAHSLTVEYSGNASFAASTSGASPLTVGKASTVINAFSTNTPTTTGQAAIYDATVVAVPPATKTPFAQYGTGGSVKYDGSIVVNFDASGHAPRTVFGLTVGVYAVTVNYLATSEFNASSVIFNHSVVKANTTTQITQFTPNPSAYYYNTTIVAVVSSTSPGTITGTVSFSVFDPIYYGDIFLGSAPIMGGTAALSFNWFTLVSQNYQYTAVYNGDGNFNGSQAQQSYFGFGYFF